jgi:hypothetical protein
MVYFFLYPSAAISYELKTDKYFFSWINIG